MFCVHFGKFFPQELDNPNFGCNPTKYDMRRPSRYVLGRFFAKSTRMGQTQVAKIHTVSSCPVSNGDHTADTAA